MERISREEMRFAPKEEDTWGLKVFKEVWKTASGKLKTYWKYSLPDTAVIAAFTADGRVISIEEFQPGVGASYPHLAAGTVDPGEEGIVTAERELLEETGYRGRVELLTTFAHDSGRSDRKVLLYIATGCEKVQEPKEEDIAVSLLTPKEFWEKCLGYIMNDPGKMHGGANSLKVLTLAFHKLGYLEVIK